MRKYDYQIGIDALELTYTANKSIKDKLGKVENMLNLDEHGEIWLVRQDPRYYKNEFAIMCKDYSEEFGLFDRLVGYLRFGSFNKNRQNVYIAVSNESIYNWVIEARFYIEEVLCLQFKQVSKLDICLDFNFNIERRLIRKYKDESFDLIINGQVADNTSVKNVGFQSFGNSRKRLFANPEILVKGGSSSMPEMKTYNKKKEIDEVSQKHYILEKTGFKSTMYRVEVSCKNHKTLAKSLKALNYSDLDLYIHLTDEQFLLTVFNHLINRLIRLRKGRKRIGIIQAVIEDL